MIPTDYLWVLGFDVWAKIHVAFGFLLCLGTRDRLPWLRKWAHFHDAEPLGGVFVGGSFQK
jgi:hypothetical protein